MPPPVTLLAPLTALGANGDSAADCAHLSALVVVITPISTTRTEIFQAGATRCTGSTGRSSLRQRFTIPPPVLGTNEVLTYGCLTALHIPARKPATGLLQ
jgi:hypothetical protein